MFFTSSSILPWVPEGRQLRYEKKPCGTQGTSIQIVFFKKENNFFFNLEEFL